VVSQRRVLAEERGGAPARVAFLTQAEPRFRGTELHEQAGYRLGLALYAVGQKEEAKARLVLTAEAHPHPYGGLTDDAYWHAARIAHELGRPKRPCRCWSGCSPHRSAPR
jgi:hypothetical protein